MIVCRRITEVQPGEFLDYVSDITWRRDAGVHEFGANPIVRMRVNRVDKENAYAFGEIVQVCPCQYCQSTHRMVLGREERWELLIGGRPHPNTRRIRP